MLDEFWYADREDKVVRKIDIHNKSILIDLRDEAHRFAILHHRKARARNSKGSEISAIEGVGEKSRIKLLKHFKNVEGIKQASLEELNTVLKNRKISKLVFDHFNV